DVGTEQDLDPLGPKDAADLFRDVPVLVAEELRPVLDNAHAAAEAAIRLGEFEAHVSATEDDEMRGQPVDFEQLDVRHGDGLGQTGDRWDRGVGSDVQEDPLAHQRARSALPQADLQRSLADEPPLAYDQVGTAGLVEIE